MKKSRKTMKVPLNSTSNKNAGRRQFIRKVGVTTAAIGTTSVAGCAGLLQSSTETTSNNNISSETNAMSKHELNSFVSKKINSYGNSGVWGTAQTEPDHGLEYVGSWDASKPFGDNSDKKKANALLDGVVILYRIPDKVSENGNQHYQFWLWAGVGPSKAEQSAKSDIPSFDNLEAQINFKDKSYKMGAYSPGRSFASGPVSVSAQSPDVTDLAAKFPLNKGHVKFDPDSKVGSGGMYGVQWDGNYAGTQSINATCEASWPTDQKPKFDWTLRLSAKDSLF